MNKLDELKSVLYIFEHLTDENLSKKEIKKMIIDELEKQFDNINNNDNLSLMVKYDLLKNVERKIKKLRR